VSGVDLKEAHMSQMGKSVRVISAVTICSTIGLTAIACAGQPAAPSSTIATPSLASASGAPNAANTIVSTKRFGDRTPGVVFVASQGLYYDTFVVRDPLPPGGSFQLIANGQTEFGPGQPGYLGGRWWEDSNGNGVQDSDDHYFLCPLLPPGRSTP
jgi:hypothetical protein